jgi:predicted N-acetyltransferase YhbS
MNAFIRQEVTDDFRSVFNLIQRAFKTEKLSDHKEQFLVEHLRKLSSFIPELSIIAEHENKIVGYILLTKIKIRNEQAEFDSLVLAPVSVLLEFQGKGIGGKLIIHV